MYTMICDRDLNYSLQNLVITLRSNDVPGPKLYFPPCGDYTAWDFRVS